jgi:hypothetical protein
MLSCIYENGREQEQTGRTDIRELPKKVSCQGKLTINLQRSILWDTAPTNVSGDHSYCVQNVGFFIIIEILGNPELYYN